MPRDVASSERAPLLDQFTSSPEPDKTCIIAVSCFQLLPVSLTLLAVELDVCCHQSDQAFWDPSREHGYTCTT